MTADKAPKGLGDFKAEDFEEATAYWAIDLMRRPDEELRRLGHGRILRILMLATLAAQRCGPRTCKTARRWCRVTLGWLEGIDEDEAGDRLEALSKHLRSVPIRQGDGVMPMSELVERTMLCPGCVIEGEPHDVTREAAMKEGAS